LEGGGKEVQKGRGEIDEEEDVQELGRKMYMKERRKNVHIGRRKGVTYKQG
jgi:hypothetical protein